MFGSLDLRLWTRRDTIFDVEAKLAYKNKHFSLCGVGGARRGQAYASAW